MKYRFIAPIALVLIFCVCLISSKAFADDPRFLSAYHSEYGLKLYHDGKMDLAADRFTKALLLDPHNDVAKDSLQKIAKENSAVIGTRSLKILRFIDQIEYFTFLNDRFQNLISANNRLLDFVLNNSTNDPSLTVQIQTLKTQQNFHPNTLPQVGVLGFAEYDTQNLGLDEIIIALSRDRQAVIKEINFWEEQNSQLRNIKRKILDKGATEAATAIATKYKNEFELAQGSIAEKDKLLTAQHESIEYFQNQLSAVRENYNTLTEKFQSTDVKIAELTQKLAAMSMEVFEKNKILAEKDHRAADLEKEILDAHEKMSLVQRIIQEKDERIASLEKEMMQLQVAVSNGGALSDQNVAQMKADMDDFKTQFKAQMEKSRDRIIGLEIQFVDITQKYQALAHDVQVKDTQIAALKSTVQKKDVAINQYRDAFLSTDKKANELIGMVEIYRGKLSETKQSFFLKEEQLRRLEAALTKTEEKPLVDSTLPQNLDQNFSDNFDLTISKNTQSNIKVMGR
ncbi:MAG: hypothetical protein H6754_04185 [Candidatus Omnitrophica bacterium]|nr:hypothetical protein [Candidatus Omnitrophota bacterium]